MTDSAADGKFARRAWLRALERTARLEREPHVTLPEALERLALERGDAPALLGRESSLSWNDFAGRLNRYARWGLEALESGDIVALVMGSSPEYLCVWLGLCRVGVTVALINPQLEGAALRHSIDVVRPKVIIVDAAHAPALETERNALAGPARLLIIASSERDAPLDSLESLLAAYPTESLAGAERRRVPLEATALYIYTSGTTGLPKAARVSHYRLQQWSQWFAGLLDTGPEDRMYDCLPLYHSVGGVVATGSTLLGGGAVVLRERFSVSEFWSDVHREGCTLFQYIGELCRYLVNAPAQPLETAHRLRIACGNGLRADVWERFRVRFNIPRIIEYYASTEGNFSLYNCEGEAGAIGRIPPFLTARQQVALVRFDVATGEPARNPGGFCEPCEVGEVGEAIGQIADDPGTRVGRFEGYLDAEATQRKILRSVFISDDRWYRTGDLMRRDARGFFYFVDRIGDTFRWKGENVATSEVAGVLCGCPGVREAAVYGVAVPGADGRAGMAALVVDADFDLEPFAREVAAQLPVYARPLFLRLIPGIAITGTFKPRIVELQQAGFDPSRTEDALYVYDARKGLYAPLDAAGYAAILEGKHRL